MGKSLVCERIEDFFLLKELLELVNIMCKICIKRIGKWG